MFTLFSFFLSFSFHYYSSFLTFSVFSYFSCLYLFIFRIFVSFTFRTISILSISHFVFLLNISVFFSLCARINWQSVCQFLSANFPLYCIVLYRGANLLVLSDIFQDLKTWPVKGKVVCNNYVSKCLWWLGTDTKNILVISAQDKKLFKNLRTLGIGGFYVIGYSALMCNNVFVSCWSLLC